MRAACVKCCFVRDSIVWCDMATVRQRREGVCVKIVTKIVEMRRACVLDCTVLID